MVLTRNQLLTDGWRLWIDRYAETVSEGQWIIYPWLKYIFREIQSKIVNGNARIIINAPPRHGKSEAISHWLPVWFLDWYPDRKVILASYGDEFATEWGMKVRDEFLDSELVWTKVHKDRAFAGNWKTYYKTGGMECVGVGGSITGKGCHLGIIDDPHKNYDEAHSSVYQRKIINWFNATFYPRLEPNASIVLIMTRWHENDLTGYLINEHSDDWIVIRLPALAEDENDLLDREIGEALCPERYSKEVLQKIKKAQGSYIFNALYQQRPAPPEGSLIKRDWFNRYIELPQNPDEWLQGWDFTFTDKGTSFVCGEVWCRKEANCYLVDLVKEKLDFPGMVRAVKRMSKRWPQATTKLVEKAANGYAIISTLEDKIPGLIGWSPGRSSKEARLVAVSPLIEAGNVYLPTRDFAPWVDDFIEEVVTFPNAANNDQVDAMSMSLLRLRQVTPETFDFVIPDSGVRQSPWSF